MNLPPNSCPIVHARFTKQHIKFHSVTILPHHIHIFTQNLVNFAVRNKNLSQMAQSMKTSLVAKQYIFPFILITLLFFLWGGARAVMDVLNKHFQLTMEVTKTHSALMQAVVYGAYFLMALPAGIMIRRLGTRIGVIVGLLLFGGGSLLFLPISDNVVFEYVLLPLFIIGCGLVILETAANPYVTLLGDPRTSAGRLNLAQSFNGLGSILGVLLGGQFFFAERGGEVADIAIPYSVIGIIVLIVALCFSRVKLPELVTAENDTSHGQHAPTKLGKYFFFGFITLICYEISEISINTFFINYMTDDGFLSPNTASLLLSIGGLGLFMTGRFAGSALMSRISSEKILLICACGTTATMILAISPLGVLSKCAVIVCYVFESIMFPTIFALSISRLGGLTERASSILMMSVVGGAIGPLAMGWIGDHFSISAAFAVPLAGFIVVLAFAWISFVKSRHKA